MVNLPISFLLWIRGTGKQLINTKKHLVGSDVTLCIGVCFYRHVSLSLMLCHGTCIIHNVKKCGLNGACCDCNYFTLISILWRILCAKFTYSVFTTNYIYVHSFHQVEPLFTDTWWAHLRHQCSTLYSVFSQSAIHCNCMVEKGIMKLYKNHQFVMASLTDQVGSSGNALAFMWDMSIILIFLTSFHSVQACLQNCESDY